MPYPIFVTVANGQAVSSAFYFDRPDRVLAVHVPSHAALAWTVAFAATSGTAPFARTVTPETGLHYVGSFASGGWLIVPAATPYGRIETGGNVSATTTCTILPIMR